MSPSTTKRTKSRSVDIMIAVCSVWLRTCGSPAAAACQVILPATTDALLDRDCPERQNQKRRIFRRSEGLDTSAFSSQQFGDRCGPSVADIEPDDLGRKALDIAAVAEISVLRCDRKSVRRGVRPDIVVARSAEPDSLTCALPEYSAASAFTSLWLTIASKRSFTRAQP
jgi:hypothetical protein